MLLPVLRHLGMSLTSARVTDLAYAACVLDRASGSFPDAALRQQLTDAFEGFIRQGGRLSRRLGDTASLRDGVRMAHPQAPETVTTLVSDLLAANDTESPERLGLGTFGQYFFGEKWVANDDMFVEGGYGAFVEALADGLTVRTSTVVSRIAQDDHEVVVSTSTGELRGSHVIVTAPLAVLQAGSIEFSPPLSAVRTTALTTFGVGSFERVALALPAALRPELPPRPVAVVDPEGRGWPLVLNLQQWGGRPAIVAYTTGDHARRVAQLSEQERIDEVVAIASEIAGEAVVPDHAVVSNWTSDPFSLGSYSHVPRGSAQRDVHHAARELAKPHGRILFAGEATAGHRMALVDGAYASGVREAKRLLQRRRLRLF